MDIKHNLCKQAEKSHTMQRLYKRLDGMFVGCAWMCTDCGQMQRD